MGTQAALMRAPAPAGKEIARPPRAVMRASKCAHEAATARHAPNSFAAIPAFAPGECARAGSSVLSRVALQRKLAIGAVDDPLEHETGRVAERVMRMPELSVSRAGPLRLSRKCAECEEEEKGKLQKKSAGEAATQTAPPIVHEVLASPGAPLDAATRAFMEPRFGYDFSRVRVHSGAAAARSAQAVNAHAYTAGHHVVFGAGEFAPATRNARRLIAHELTHVVQQSGSDRICAVSTFPIQIQRDEIEMEGMDVHPKGLLVEKRIKGVTGRWVALWRSKKDLTIRALLDSMIAILNVELRGLREAPIVFDPTPATTEGGFRYQEWRMQINLDVDLGRTANFDDKASSVSADELAVIGNTLYHEARHAEQYFMVARTRASSIKDADVLAKTLDIPVSVAKAAILAGRPGRDDPDVETIEEWSAFAPGGRYFAYWQWNQSMGKVTADTLEPIVTRSPSTVDEFKSTADDIDLTINVLSTHWSFPYDQIADIEQLPAPKRVDTGVLAQLRKITSAFDKLVRAIDDFRTKVLLLERIKSHPDETEVRILEAHEKWIGVRLAKQWLFLAQSDNAYLAYPHEEDARRAGEAAKLSIIAATRPARAR
jgi:hypothetical protein